MRPGTAEVSTSNIGDRQGGNGGESVSMIEHVQAFMWISMKVEAEVAFGTGFPGSQGPQAPKTVETRDGLIQK